MSLLRGKRAIVTGAGSGIGRGIAIELAREGAKVVVSDHAGAVEIGQETVAMIAAEGHEAVFTTCDVTQQGAAAALVEAAVTSFGGLDIAVNNAGIGVHKPLIEHTDEDWENVISVNMRGVFRGMRAQIGHMKANGGGAIVNISSVAGLCAVNNIGVYVGSKFGIEGLTKSAAMENGQFNVRVNAICPNAIRTPLLVQASPEFQKQIIDPQAIKRMGEPEEVGAAAAFLLSDKASYITGVSLPVDGGFMTGAGATSPPG